MESKDWSKDWGAALLEVGKMDVPDFQSEMMQLLCKVKFTDNQNQVMTVQDEQV